MYSVTPICDRCGMPGEAFLVESGDNVGLEERARLIMGGMGFRCRMIPDGDPYRKGRFNREWVCDVCLATEGPRGTPYGPIYIWQDMGNGKGDGKEDGKEDGKGDETSGRTGE